MSYTVDIVMSEAPETYEDALAIRDELIEVRDERLASAADKPAPSPKMADLHRCLTARYPCICDDPSGPWADGPLINNFGQDIATLGISFSRVAEVLPFLITTANEMGFWVLDPEDEVVHLAGGVAIRPLELNDQATPQRPWWQFWK